MIESKEKHEKKTELLQDAKAYSSMLEVWQCALTATGVCGEVASLDHMMMMIAFITIKISLVPLIEGLCAQI